MANRYMVTMVTVVFMALFLYAMAQQPADPGNECKTACMACRKYDQDAFEKKYDMNGLGKCIQECKDYTPDESPWPSFDCKSYCGTVGKWFMFNFPTSLHQTWKAPILMISTPSMSTVSVIVSVPGIGFHEETTTTRQQHAEIKLPLSAYLEQDSSLVQDKTVIVRANAGVSVYGMAALGADPDAFLAIPVHGLGKEYFVSTSGPNKYWSRYPTVFSMSAVEDLTDIQIDTPGGQKLITMNANESYQIDSYNDLTGSAIRSNKPIAVMAGSAGTGIPVDTGTDMLLEMLPSTDMYGVRFTLGPFLGRSNGHMYRIIAPEQTTVQISENGMTNYIIIQSGQFVDNYVIDNTATLIESEKRVMVVQYTLGVYYGSPPYNGDASMVIVPPIEMFAGNVTFPVLDIALADPQLGLIYTNYISIIAACTYIPDMMYDDTTDVADWELLTVDDMCVSRAEVTPGTHSVGHPDKDATFSVTVYGHYRICGFSYPVGFKTTRP